MVDRRNNIPTNSLFEIDKLKHIPLPPKIRCGRCTKNLVLAKFSTKQQTDARWQIKNKGSITIPIKCHTCTGPQLVELECFMCHKTKGLEEFAKSQRRIPDNAKCYKCTEEQVNTLPVNDERYENIDTAFAVPDFSGGSAPDYWSSASSSHESSSYDDSEWASVRGDQPVSTDGGVALSSQFQQALSINDSNTETLLESEYAFGGGVGINNGNGGAARSQSWHTGSAGAASTNTGINGNRYGRPSATSNTGTAHTITSSVAERSDNSGEIRSNSSAEIRADQPPTYGTPGIVRPADDARLEVEDDVNPWNDGSDEEDDDYASGSDDSDGENTVI